MNLDNVKQGLRVKTTELGSTKGMTIRADYLANRQEGVTGTIMGWVPGHGGDVWWVKHDGEGEVVGAYVFNEFEPA